MAFLFLLVAARHQRTSYGLCVRCVLPLIAIGQRGLLAVAGVAGSSSRVQKIAWIVLALQQSER